MRLSLAVDTFDTCSQSLPARSYESRFTLDMDGGPVDDDRGEADDGPDDGADSASPSPSPTPSPTSDPDEPSAAKKYSTPVDPDSTPAWVYPVVAVSVVVLLGAALVVGRLLVRRQRQGW